MDETPKIESEETKTMRNVLILIILALIVMSLIGLYLKYGDSYFNQNMLNCTGGIAHGKCSINKPLYCYNGTLINKSLICGCPTDYKIENNTCQKILRCNDSTIYGECSQKKPIYCMNGTLVEKASICGCPYGGAIRQEGDKCTDLSKPNTTLLESKIHELINLERQKNGLSTLSWNDKLVLAARGHSQDMATRNYFSHDSPEGHNFVWRYAQVGFTCSIMIGNTIYIGAENLYQDWTYGTIYYINGIETSREWYSLNEIAENAVNGWMNSPGHRQNILTPYWQSEGIGVAVSSDGKVYITQNFC